MTSIYMGIAGILGALTRYAFSMIWNPSAPNEFPWGTLICNYTGCLLLSFIAFSKVIRLPAKLRLAISTGFIGAFTTFSTLSYETFAMLHTGHSLLALAYVLVSLWGGLIFTWIGSRVAEIWPSRRRLL